MLSCESLYFAILKRMLKRSGMSMHLQIPSTLQMQGTVAVYTSGSKGSSEGNSVSFTWCFASVIQYLQCPVAAMSA